jgi:multiple antibiotic resistance protein
MGYEMLNSRPSTIKYDESDVENAADDIAITPMGIPMLAGPGSITNAIVLMQDANTLSLKLVLPIVIFLILFITYLALVGAGFLAKYIGETGNKVLLKLMGLIIMVIAVEFFFKGLTPIIQGIIFP